MTNAEIRQARQTNLVSFLRNRGEELKPIGKEFCLKEHPSLHLRKNFFFWHSRGISGNSVDFCVNYYGMSFKDAVIALISSDADTVNTSDYRPQEKKQLSGSEADISYAPDCRRVLGYLCGTRCISYQTVLDFIHTDLLRQDMHHNCVFRCLDDSGKFLGAELHGTYSGISFRQCIGSGGFQFRSGQEIKFCCFFESAIDLMSFYQIYQDRCQNHLLVSMAGLKQNILLDVVLQHPETRIFLCTDNDSASDNFIRKVQEQNSRAEYFRPPSEFKDWNEYLCKRGVTA